MSISDLTQPKRVKKNQAPTRRIPAWLLRLGLALAFALIGLMVATTVIVAGYNVLYRDKIHRGVHVRHLDLGGMNRSAAQAVLTDYFAELSQKPWELRDGQRTWKVTPAALGVRLDAKATTDAAFAVGRAGSLGWNLGEQIRSASQGVQIAPVVLYDEAAARRYFAGLAEEIEQPLRDASLIIDGLQVHEIKPQVGRRLDIETTLTTLTQAVKQLEESEIDLVIVETLPRLIDATIARDRANVMISQPLTLVAESSAIISTTAETAPASPWQLSREELAAMLIISEDPVGDDSALLKVTLDQDKLRTFLAPISQVISRTATNARFIFNDDTHQLEVIAPSSDGLELDVEATINRINERAAGTEREVPLVLNVIPAEFNESLTAEALGISELIASDTSYFAGSSAGRMNNVQIAASKFHGIIIKSGETFSFNQWLGEVSEEEGYDESLIIFGNETIPDVGGGVCQVSSTAFGAAFWAGFPITERWAHAYRVGYYEQGGRPLGMDATVYSPLVDLKFVNDLPHPLLIETYVNLSKHSLTFKFYSTGNGRTVEMEDATVSDVIEHGDPIYKEDPDLEPGEIEQIEWATDGMTAVITRAVHDGTTGEVVKRQEFKSKFRPWDAVYLVGPGTEVPGHDVIRLDEQEQRD